jgi:hypothetical protein
MDSPRKKLFEYYLKFNSLKSSTEELQLQDSGQPLALILWHTYK